MTLQEFVHRQKHHRSNSVYSESPTHVCCSVFSCVRFWFRIARFSEFVPFSVWVLSVEFLFWVEVQIN